MNPLGTSGPDWLLIFLRLVAASVAGIALGLPTRLQPGGVRAHSLVCVGASLFCITGVQMAGAESQSVLRIVQGIASGIGFVGAATVLKGAHHIYGVSNAASIWSAAAVGCAVGFGHLGVAMGMAAFVTVLSWGLKFTEHRYFARPVEGSDPPLGPL